MSNRAKVQRIRLHRSLNRKNREEDAYITREEIERSFVDAGWEMPGSPHYPIVGNAEDLSIVAHEQYAQGDDPVFEIVDGRRMLSYWSRVIVTPRQAWPYPFSKLMLARAG